MHLRKQSESETWAVCDKEEWQEGVGWGWGAKGSFAAEQVLSEVLETCRISTTWELV